MSGSFSFLRIVGLGDLAGRGWRALFSFWSVVILTFFLFGDQNLTSANLSRIGAAFGFTEENDYRWYIASLPAVFFFLVGGAMSIATGLLNDFFVKRRKLLLVLSVVVGETACLLTAFAQDYWTFLILRTLTGVGLGGIFPVMFSLLGDYFRPENRPTASGWLGLAMALGIGVGQVLAGVLAHASWMGLEGWRLSFIIMAAPAFPIAMLYYFFGSTPERGEADGAAETSEEQHRVTLKDLAVVFKNRTNIVALLQGMPGTVPWALLFFYVVDFLEKVRGFKPAEGAFIVTAFGLAAILGGFGGGFIGKYLYNKNRRMLPLFCAVTVILGSLPVFFMLNYSGGSIPMYLVAAFAGGILAPMTGANVRAILVNTNLPENRGSIFALYNLTDDIGKGLGPFFVGLLLLLFARMNPGDSKGMVLLTYNVAVSFWIICGAVWFFMIPTMPGDEDRVREILKARGARSGDP